LCPCAAADSRQTSHSATAATIITDSKTTRRRESCPQKKSDLARWAGPQLAAKASKTSTAVRYSASPPSQCSFPATMAGIECHLDPLLRLHHALGALLPPRIERCRASWLADTRFAGPKIGSDQPPPHDRARGLTVPGRRCGHLSRGCSAPDSTHDQPEAPHWSQLHLFRSKIRGGGRTSKWPSAGVILPAPTCLGTCTVSAAPSPLGQSGHGHGNCRCS